jgi:hypothetical protein
MVALLKRCTIRAIGTLSLSPRVLALMSLGHIIPDHGQKCRQSILFDERPEATTKLIAKVYPLVQKSQTTWSLDVIRYGREMLPVE